MNFFNGSKLTSVHHIDTDQKKPWGKNFGTKRNEADRVGEELRLRQIDYGNRWKSYALFLAPKLIIVHQFSKMGFIGENRTLINSKFPQKYQIEV